MEKKEKNKQKITIIILSILLCFFAISFFTNLIINNIEKNTYNVEITDIYKTPPSQTSKFTIEITCKKNITIKVSDFSFKMENGNFMLINSLTYNNKEYKNEESFVVYPYKENKIIINKTLDFPTESNLYFKMTKLDLNQEQNFR